MAGMYHCPGCTQPLDAPDLAGQEVACPACGTRFVMPGASVVTYQPQQRVVVHHYHRGRDRASGMLAALLSALLPGLGQMCQGRLMTGICFLLLALVAAIPLLLMHPLGLLYFVVLIVAVVEAAQN